MVLITSQFFSQYKIQETYLQNPLVFFSVQNTRNISTKPPSFFLSTKYKLQSSDSYIRNNWEL